MQEDRRLASLHALDILGAPREPALDKIAHLARLEFGASHAGIMLIDRRQAIFAARDNIAMKSMPREQTFCNITIQSNEPLIIPDALLDVRIQSDNRILCNIRSYAGVPLQTRDGCNVGSLCVFDSELLDFPEPKIRKLKELALLAMDCIELRRLATQDHLTGAMNRRGFMSELDRRMRRCSRNQETLSLVLMDLDHFKQINDRFGHPVGDRVLQAIVKIMSREWDEAHVIGRLGGEEFGLLLPGHGELSAFAHIERLRAAIQAMSLPDVPDLHVTASFGVAEIGPEIEKLTDLIAMADAALYRAKALSRNMTVLARSPTFDG